MSNKNEKIKPMSQRAVLKRATAAAATVAATSIHATVADGPAATKGRIKQSLVHWCYSKYWEPPQLAAIAKQLGCVSIELIDPKFWPVLKEAGLTCASPAAMGLCRG